MKMKERLQKFLSAAGIASRRAAEKMMLEGRVSVNGKLVTELGSKVDPSRDAIKVDGKLVRFQRYHYVLLHKPKGTLCTLDDPAGRPRVTDLVQGLGVRLYPVGRLDYDTTGALLLTNDGELANLLMHPRHRVAKTYLAKVKGIPSQAVLQKLCQGFWVDGRRTAPAEVRIRKVWDKNSLLELILREGRNKQIKHMCLAVGHPVLQLTRTAIGFLRVEDLAPGSWRHLTAAEVKRLKKIALQDHPRRPEAAPRAGAKQEAA